MTIQIHIQGTYADGSKFSANPETIEDAIRELEWIEAQAEAIESGNQKPA